MSLQIPLIGVASRYVSRLGHLPSSIEVKHLLVTDNIDGVFNLIKNSFHIADNNIPSIIQELNHYYQKEIDEILHLLPHDSAPFIYLQLQKDFENVKKITLNQTVYGEILGEKAFLHILSEIPSQLYYSTEFKQKLLAKQDKIIHSPDSFGIISYLEEVFLTLLFEHLKDTSRVMKHFILTKINSYTLLNVLARTQKGQSREHIIRHLLPIQGSFAINAVKRFSFGDILGDIGQFLHLSPADINIINIENTLIRKEINAINKAQFTGMSGDRIIQYTERLHYAIANIKLLLLQYGKQIDSKQAKLRFINYSAI